MIDGNSIAESIKSRAKSQGVDTMEAMRRFAMERLIVRLKQSDQDERMVLKGGMLWWLTEHLREHARPTADIDIHFHEPLTHDEVLQMLETTSGIDVDDGCRFDFHHPKALEHTGEHEGLRVKVRAWLGERFVDFHIDIGFGGTRPDWLSETEFSSMHPKIPGGSMTMAPLEFVVAEKLHAIVKIGMKNTRLKDYNDLYVMSGMKFDQDRLIEAIRTTFADRVTDIPAEMTAGFTEDYARQYQDQWVGWVSGARRKGKVPEDFGKVVNTVAEFASITFEISAEYSHEMSMTN